jgi:hypothetical protein
MNDDEFGQLDIVDPNDPKFFPNFDEFKERVNAIGDKDEKIRDYLIFRRNRLDDIKKSKKEKNG